MCTAHRRRHDCLRCTTMWRCTEGGAAARGPWCSFKPMQGPKATMAWEVRLHQQAERKGVPRAALKRGQGLPVDSPYPACGTQG